MSTATIDQAATDSTVTTDQATDTDQAATDTPVTDPAITKLEKDAARFIAAGVKAGTSLAGILVKLYSARGWEAHEQSISDYYRATIGIGEEGFILPKPARQQVVVMMSDANPDAPLAHMVHMTGCSLRTINRDRGEWEVANPNRVNSHKPAGDDTGDDDTDDTDDTPVKARKTRVQTVNLVEI
ncbi:MAG TPA: hypothetical protein VGM12_15475, partial [Trebonia sp.]